MQIINNYKLGFYKFNLTCIAAENAGLLVPRNSLLSSAKGAYL